MSSGSRDDLPAHSPFADDASARQSVALLDESVAATPLANASATAESLQLGTPPTPYANPFSPPETPARNSYIGSATASPDPSRPILSEDANRNDPGAPLTEAGVLSEKPRPINRRRRLFIWLGVGAAAIVVVVLAVILPVYFTVIKKSSSSSGSGASGGGSGGSSTNPESPTGATSGGDGSVITLSDGSSFTYSNKFGGFWVDDPTNPYNNSARPNSWTPALNEPWDYSSDKIYGVNLGGWLVLEPFIVPALFEKYQNVTPNAAIPGGQAVDEWTLSVAMLNDTSDGGGIGQLEEHYKTFVTEQDFAEIAGAGLNWIRLPIPYWAIETWPGEPFLAKTAWNYVLLAFKWARKYGLRIYLELHTVPGSQNGYNHSGRLGPINFLNGYMGIANAQRTMDYIRYIAEFISQQEYEDVVPMFGIINEPLLGIIGRDQLTRFYLQGHDMIRDITGIGKGAYIVIHDGFQGTGSWKDFLPGSDRIILDTHPYVAFGGDFDHPLDYWPSVGCQAYSNNQSQLDFGITISGEFSGAINNCGKWVIGVGQNSTYAQCPTWNDWPNWTQDMKTGIKNFVMSQMDGMGLPGYFFWTWKVGNSSVTGRVEAPLWSYKLGLDNGWIPTDPREAQGLCVSLNLGGSTLWNGTYESWQTGGSGAGTIAATALASFSQYPPPALSNVNGANPTQLPMYTATSAVPTLPTPSFSAATTTGGDGWADPADTSLAAVQIAGCVYPDAWGPAVDSTALVCGGSTVAAAATAAATA
ncbi:glycoside hydrolase [Lentinus tigrinus ALCF2SS1-7]|uniref:glucan 1,3-beta-glucosidase n=1 Tax=Lentinus tigrinus ALCF2SS1-6 TaxID=1328759 RepID=A0A5C2SEJ0_9APHY|nr:glycoside hydrolase [Lentinus tigrinus ALCF2SS1-6]RPD74662.1 glycoside hydrolase [Lentinus tigrinus ALCF2SS1-7]